MSTEVIVAFITGVLGPVILLYAKNKFEKRSSKFKSILALEDKSNKK